MQYKNNTIPNKKKGHNIDRQHTQVLNSFLLYFEYCQASFLKYSKGELTIYMNKQRS